MTLQRLRRSLIALLLGLVMLPALAVLPLQAQRLQVGLSKLPAPPAIVPLVQQPFYGELLETLERWQVAPLAQVAGDSPRSTLLDFYGVMVLVADGLKELERLAPTQSGLGWGADAQASIARINTLFGEAQAALNGTSIPESIRSKELSARTLQLKEVLDVLLATAPEPFEIPDLKAMAARRTLDARAAGAWTLPHSPLSLTTQGRQETLPPIFRFSADSVDQIPDLYNRVASLPRPAQPFATPGLYRNFALTPGHLIPPLWYFKLPSTLRQWLEIPLLGNSLLQLLLLLLGSLIYASLLVTIVTRFLETCRRAPVRGRGWLRVGLCSAIPLLNYVTGVFIDDVVNTTGWTLAVSSTVLLCLSFVSISYGLFLLCEQLGLSLSSQVARWSGRRSDLELRRISSLLMPLSRALGGVLSLAAIYTLLIVLGLPSSTVLAFSAVPGLAIGLGASKLLGNLFAGLSLQADRPLRVGEFCQIGPHLGYIQSIGLRSLELQTSDGLVTIPNSVVDEQTIVNYSPRSSDHVSQPQQSLNLRVPLQQVLNETQLQDLLHLIRKDLINSGDLIQPTCVLDSNNTAQQLLICDGLIEQGNWPRLRALRERIMIRIAQRITQVCKSEFLISVASDTAPALLRTIPELVERVIEQAPQFQFRASRVWEISNDSLQVQISFVSSHDSDIAFKDAVSDMNANLLAALANAGIAVSQPTRMQLQRRIDDAKSD